MERVQRIGAQAIVLDSKAIALKVAEASEGAGWISMDVGHIHIHGS
jgi:hypothetical protein